MTYSHPVEPRVAAERSTADVVADALRDEELMRQLRESLDEEHRGEPAVPFQHMLDDMRKRRSA